MSFLDGAASSLVSGIFGTVNGLLDRNAQNANIDKQIEAQAAENQKTREYNLNLAKMQNQWNLEQWNRENEYNTPLQQRQRLAEAGLNPDLMYQNGVSGLTAASSPTMTSGAPATPQDFSALGQKKTVGQAMQEGLQMSMLGAQLELTRAQADKVKSETEGQNLTNKNILALDSAELDKRLAEADLTKKQKEEVSQNIENLKKVNTQLEYLIANINLQNQGLTQQQLFERLNFSLNRTKLRTEIMEGLARYGYTKAQTDALLKKLPYELSILSQQYYSERGDLNNVLGHFLHGFDNGGDYDTFIGNLGSLLGNTQRSFITLGEKWVSTSVDALAWLLKTFSSNNLGTAVGNAARNIGKGALRKGLRDAMPWAFGK